MASRAPKTINERTASFRARKRAEGLRLVQRWAVDTRTPEFALQARTQSRIAAGLSRAADDQAFVDAAGSWD